MIISKGEATNEAEYKVLQTFFSSLGQNLWVGAFTTQPGTPFQWLDGTSLPITSSWWCSG